MMTDTVPMDVPESRLRRFIAYPLTLLVIGAVFVVGAVIAAGRLVRLLPHIPNSPLSAFEALLVGLAAVLGYKAFRRWVERTPDTDFALPGAAGELALGLVMGLAIFSAATGVVALLGGYEVLGVRGLGEFWSMLAVALFSGPFEETLFRALGLRLLEKVVGTGWALGLTSAFFGIAHLTNPGSTLFAAFAIAVEAGILLGGAYLLTRRLWLAIGIHAGWNFTQGWIFSIPVSGGNAPLGLLISRRIGPDWLTGGNFGLEASVVAMVVATLAGVGLLVLARRRAPFVAPRWSRTHTKL
jgi:membrane protease YdiL (CAAX protease family)